MATTAEQLTPIANMLEAVGQAQLRDREVKKDLRKALNKVKRLMVSLIPPPGYPGDKEGYRPLRKTVAVRIRTYGVGQVWYATVGPTYSNTPRIGGNHAHLVEDGTAPHEIPTPKDNPTRVINHPGSDAREFAKRTWDAMSNDLRTEIANIAGQHMLDAIRAQLRGEEQKTQGAAAQAEALAGLRRLQGAA